MTATATPQPVRVSTEALAPGDQRPAWDAWFEPVFSLDHSVADAPDFPAEAVFWPLGSVGLSRVRAPRLRAMRGERHVRRDPTDHWSITFGAQETRLTLPQGRVIVPANRPFVTSLGQTVVSERAADERHTLFLARDRFAAVGEACGFHDPSSFSRALRREFGAAPMEVRAAALSGGSLRLTHRPQLPAETASLRDALRAL